MDQIARMLELMGSTPDHVAATLRGARISGHRTTTSSLNPVIRYLKQNLDLDAYLELGPGGESLFVFDKYTIREIELPAPVKGFLERFNRGLYPALEHP